MSMPLIYRIVIDVEMPADITRDRDTFNDQIKKYALAQPTEGKVVYISTEEIAYEKITLTANKQQL